MAVPLVSRIAEKLGLPGNSPDAVDSARDKHNTRAKMEAAGLPTPRNMLIKQPSDLQPAADKVKFPAGAVLLSALASMPLCCLSPHNLVLMFSSICMLSQHAVAVASWNQSGPC